MKACEMDKVFFTNSGTEAIEGALKAAQKICLHQKWSRGRYEIHCYGTILSMEEAWEHCLLPEQSITETPFEPLIPGVKFAKFNDLDSVKALVSDKTCAIILEARSGGRRNLLRLLMNL